MKNKKAFTLVETVISLLLISVVAAAFFPTISRGVKLMSYTKAITEKVFLGQEQVEREIIKLNEKDSTGWGSSSVNLFGQTVPLKTREFRLDELEGFPTIDGSEGNRRLVLALSEERTFIPKTPEIREVHLNTMDDIKFQGTVTYGEKEPGKSWEENVEFCIYRWYIGDLSDKDKDFNKVSTSGLSLIKEYNPVYDEGTRLFDKLMHFSIEDGRQDIKIGGKVFKIIAGGHKAAVLATVPSTKSSYTTEKTRDEFWKYSLNLKEDPDVNNFTEEEMKVLYANKGLVFSATPIAKETGLVGLEKFSSMKSLKYKSINDDKISLGIAPIPETLESTHLLEGVAVFYSGGELVKNKKLKITLDGGGGNIQSFNVVTDDKGYALFSKEISTENSWKIRAEDFDHSEVFVEGSIEFRKYNLKFKDAKPSYPSGKLVNFLVGVSDSSNQPAKGVFVEYAIEKSGKVVHRSRTYTDREGEALLKSNQRNSGEYLIRVEITTSNGIKYKFTHNFKIR